MKIFRLPDRLDRMPMLKILVFFAAGIALAGRYELPLWFLAGAFVVTGVLALSLRSSAATAAMILTAGFAAAAPAAMFFANSPQVMTSDTPAFAAQTPVSRCRAAAFAPSSPMLPRTATRRPAGKVAMERSAAAVESGLAL